ncbi:hypothetical protein ABIQ69_11345 [Agromyces sp. G08B096]|uniref:Uncharacterized protein n=1 Tax=Agromyces sp. G08B096 TaxID=3156399 RepID=A0AAU7W6Y9_9MICO
MTDTIDALAKMREPVPSDQIHYLTKAANRDDKNKLGCKEQNGKNVSADGIYCGGYHVKSFHIAYWGHADLTNRLLEADPEWSWEPVSFDEQGLPTFDRNGGLWIRLTVGGVTRLGYGDSQGKTGPNAVKEAIGDALRNAGMRFGAGLELWSKSDLSAAVDDGEAREWLIEAEAAETIGEIRAIWQEARKAGADKDTLDKISVLGQERLS